MAEPSTPDWRVQILPDGRRIEFVDARWARDDGTAPPGSIPVEVAVLIDGAVATVTVQLTSEQIEEAFGD